MWPDPADTETNIAYTREIAAAMKPWTTGRVYLNFIGDEGAGRVEAAFGPEKYARLQELKATWDPDEPVPPQPEHPAEDLSARRVSRPACRAGGARSAGR